MKKFRSYLLLTEQMNEVVNPQNRPHIVLEGHADVSMKQVENCLEEKVRFIKKKMLLPLNLKFLHRPAGRSQQLHPRFSKKEVALTKKKRAIVFF